MKTTVYGSIQNGGDGSVLVRWMESEKMCQIDQNNLDEGWGEECIASLTIEHEGPIKVEGIITLDQTIKEIENNLKEKYLSEWRVDNLKKQLDEYKKLKEN